MSRNKRGVSIVVSYVLLVVLSLSVAVWVYGWLRGNVGVIETAECPEDVVVQISNYNYSGDILNLTISNKGLFNIERFRIRVNDDREVDFGVYTVNWTGTNISFGEEVQVNNINDSVYYSESDQSTPRCIDGNNCLSPVSLEIVDVQPMVLVDEDYVFCKKIATQRIQEL